jgi:CRP-like cAMP-binding protein
MPSSDPQTLIEHIEARFQEATATDGNLLSGLDPQQRQKLLARSTIFHAEQAQEVIKSGLREDAVFMVLAGTLDVFDQTRPSLLLQTLQPGAFFGEMAWLTGASRHNRVIAREPSELLLISADVLRSLLKHAPDIAAIIMYNMARTLALRLQANSQRIPAPFTDAPNAQLFDSKPLLNNGNSPCSSNAPMSG